jgi:hypothetical protein
MLLVKRKAIDKLVSAGNAATALTALIGLVKAVVTFYPQVEPPIHQFFQSMFALYGYNVDTKGDNPKAMLLDSLRVVSKNPDMVSSVDFGRLTDSTLRAILYSPPASSSAPSPLA